MNQNKSEATKVNSIDSSQRTTGGSIKEHITELLLSNKRHARYVAILSCLALMVAVGVAGMLRQYGTAMTHKQTVLDCHYSGNGAHTHVAECYDADGNLVCPLVERELHTHDDSCYLETSVLVCGQEESEEHTHDESCYETVRELVCGKEEVTEEHVHGPGCFELVDDEAYPAQEIQEALTKTDEDGSEYVAAVVNVKAPEGALPEGTTLRFKDIDESGEVIETKTADAIERDKGDEALLAQWEVVDFDFYDQEGNEVEPKAPVEVKLTTEKMGEIEQPVLVQVTDHEKSERGEDAVVLNQADVVDQNGAPAEDGDTFKFETSELSPFVICDVQNISTQVITANGETYEINVAYGSDAGIPEGAHLEAKEITRDDKAYSSYFVGASKALDGRIDYVRFFDINIVSDGEKVQPEVPVQVKISLLGEAESLSDAVKVLHFGKNSTETVEATLSGETVNFDANGFSVYAVVDEGDTSEHARMKVNFYGKDLNTPIATMYVKNGDTLEELEDILYDPGAGNLTDREVFKGWTTDSNYVIEDGDNSLDIEQIRELAANANITEMDEVNYYAIILKTITATYLDDKGVTLGVQNAYARHDATSAEYTVNMAYTPEDDVHNFEGWNVSEGSSNIVGYTEGTVYENGTDITLTGDVTFSVNAPEGHWLVFDENGKGATYNAPKFIKSGETTTEPPEPARLGYTFGGWYTELAGEADETGCAPVDESSRFTFGSTISDRTTLYAKWTPAESSNYTVIIWRQNLDGDGYDFAESISLQGTTNSIINTVVQNGTGDDAFVSVDGTDKQYTGFHLKEFDQNVKIAPEGNAILNVYYDRNEYTLRYYYARSYNYNIPAGTDYIYTAVGTTGDRGLPNFNLAGNTTYYGVFNGQVVQLQIYGTGNNRFLYFNWIDGNSYYYSYNTVYTRQQVSYPAENRTFVQVNCNNDGFKQGRANGRNLEESLAYYLVNDYQRVDERNTWKDVNNSTINGDATALVSSEFLARTGAVLGTHEITGVTTDVIGVYGHVNSASRVVDMTYYYLDIKVRYEQSLAELWPTPNVAFNAQQMTSYNEVNDTGNYTTITPLLVGTWSTGANIGGLYSTMNSDLFADNDKTAYLDIYWRFEPHYEYNYNVYFSTLEDEDASATYGGKDYTLQDDLSYIVANGQGWGITTQTDTGEGYYDVNTVTFDGTTVAGRHDVNDGNINVYYDRIVRSVNFNDGIYVDGNGNTIQNNKDHQLHTQAVTFGEELSTFNEGGKYYYRPNDTNEYVFEGWYLDPEGQQPYTFSGTMPTHDVTVYAKWRQVEYRVFLHPNTTDTTLDWGSSNQSMNFRVSYGDKISAPMGTRNDYEFVGWYTDPSCSASSLFNADATVLNYTTVTADYDKTTDMTDPMDKWGQGATTNADVDRFWITKKLDLYAKWRAKLTGAQGIGVVYDANGGTNAPHDTSLYLDQADATAQAASTAPAGKVFKYWVVQQWDETQQKYVDSQQTVYPGDSFTVLRDYAKRTENPDHTPEHPSYTYTMQLRAEYGDLGGGTPTHIYFYANTHDKDGNAIPSVTTANQAKDETTYDTININEAYRVLSINEVLSGDSRYGNYKFLGWAKDANATEPWLKLNDDGTTYTVTQDGKTYTSVTEIAADERRPYDDLYAVWERNFGYLKIGKHFDVQEFYLDGTDMESRWNTLEFWIKDADGNYVKLIKETTGPNAGHFMYDGVVLAADVENDPTLKPTIVLRDDFEHETPVGSHEHQYFAYAWVPYGTYTVYEDENEAKTLLTGYNRVDGQPYSDDATVNAGTYGNISSGAGEARINNSYRGERAEIRVKKEITGNTTVDASKTFYFIVKNKSLDAYVSTADNTFTTDVAEIRVFSIHRDEVVRVPVISDSEYEIIELSDTSTPVVAPNSPLIDGSTWTASVTPGTVTPVKDGTDATNAVTITNDYMLPNVDVYLNKVATGETDPLPGSEFKLYRKNSQSEYAVDENIEWTKANTTLVLANGTLALTGLPEGDYKLTETKAPDGYIILTKDLYFTVQVSDDETTSVIVPTSGQESFVNAGASVKQTAKKDDTLVIENTPGTELPMTGGPGTNLFTIIGTTMVVGALMYCSVSRRRNERRSKD